MQMRVSREQAAENRERILEGAAKLFRERGFDAVGVDELMNHVGLTHGGFYGHFKSKEDLTAQSCGRAFSKALDDWARLLGEATKDPLVVIGQTYLSSKHRDSAGNGCLLAALGPDVSRRGASIRQPITEGVQRFIAMLSRVAPGRSNRARRQRAIAVYASFVGALVLARAVSDQALSDEILQAVRLSLSTNGNEAA